MKKMRRLQLILVAFALVIGLIGCDDTPKVPECTENQILTKDNTCEDIVVADTVAPTLSGVTDIAYTIGDDAPDYLAGITASDDVDGNVTSSITVDASAVDLTTAGTYVVTVTVSDAAGNSVSDTYNVLVSVRELTGEEKAALDLAAIDLDVDFTFPRTGANGSSYTWETSNPQVITKSGYIIQPPIGSDSVDVTITLTVKNGDYETQETYLINVEPRQESVVTSQTTLPFEGTSDEYVVANDESVNIFFVDEGNVPFIDIQEFLLLINGAIQSDILTFTPQNDDELVISYDIEWEDFDGSLYTETYSALLDFTDNTLTVDSFDFFESYVADTESDYGEGLNYVDADYRDSVQVTIPLGDYRADLVIYNDGTTTYYLMPFHVADLVFAGGIYYDVYYNGDKLWGLDTFGISSGDSEAIQEQARTSSFNSGTAPLDIREASYHFLALAFDYFYGLKMDQGVDTYYNFLVDYADSLIMKTDSTMYKTIFEIAYDMNDIHTSHQFTGYYNNPDYELSVSLDDLGDREQEFYQAYWNIQDRITEAGMDYNNMPTFRVIGDGKTAIIYLTGFTIDSPGKFSKTMTQLPETVENIVIDIAFNTGGNVGAVFRIFGYITERQMQYHSLNPVDGSAVTYYIESDYVAYEQYNWFFTTSAVTFSAGNIMASMAKELGYPLMGKHTTGGASSIGIIMTPDGSTLLISTLSVSATRIGNEVDGYEYLSIEFGIEPDYIMENVYDDAEILATIEQYFLDTAE